MSQTKDNVARLEYRGMAIRLDGGKFVVPFDGETFTFPNLDGAMGWIDAILRDEESQSIQPWSPYSGDGGQDA